MPTHLALAETPRLCSSDLSAVFRRARVVLCDIDGVLTVGGCLTAGAAEFGRAIGQRLGLVSNNSTEAPDEVAGRLRDLGLAMVPDRIILAGWEAIRVSAIEHPGARALVLGTRSIRDHAAASGLRLVSDRSAEIVILCRDLDIGYDRLATAFDLVSAGCPLVVANPDIWHPGPDGARIMETGALLAALTAARPSLSARIIGKPQHLLFEIALARFRCRADQAVMIGDNDATDICGARRAGITPVRIGIGGNAESLAEIVRTGVLDPSMPAQGGETFPEPRR